MATDRATLTRLLRERDALVERTADDVEQAIVKMGERAARQLVAALDAGAIDADGVIDLLEALGYGAATGAAVSAAIEIVNGAAALAEAMGIGNAALSAAQEAQFELWLDAVRRRFGADANQIAADMWEIAVRNKIQGVPTSQIRAELQERMEALGRRLNTEINTSLRRFDRAVMDITYENAGVELFEYFPPNTIETSRDACIRAVGSELQQTGWTREDIANFEGIDMIDAGGFNCRHQFIPFEGAA